MKNNTVISEQPASYRSRARSALHKEILDVASKLLSEHGPEGLSMRKIAEQVGASTMVLYTTFGNKHGLLEELWVEGFERLWRAEADVTDQGTAVDRLFALGTAYRNNALTNPYYYRITFGGIIDLKNLSESARKSGLQTFTVLVDLVERCMNEGDLPAGDPQEVGSFLWAGLHGIVSLELAGLLAGKTKGDKFFETSLHRLIAGLTSENAESRLESAELRSDIAEPTSNPKIKKNKRQEK